MKEELIQESVMIPEGVEVVATADELSCKGPKGEVKRKITHPKISVEKKENEIVFKGVKISKKDKAVFKTNIAHAKNMCKGASEGHEYKMKICSGHFPMNVAINNKVLSVKNLFGEKIPRELPLKEGVEVKIEGESIVLTGANKELVGQVAADIEQLTRITNRDRRIFQDGIYITEKDGKAIK